MGKKEVTVALFLAWRTLVRGKRSEILACVLITSLIFTSMIFFPALVNGIGQDLTQQVVDYQTSDILVEPKQGNQYIYKLPSTLDLINRIPGVLRASPHYEMGATLIFRGRFVNTMVHAIKPRDEKAVSPLYTTMVAGNYLGDSDTGNVIIGSQAAGSRDLYEPQGYGSSLGGVRVGDSVVIDYANNFRKEYQVKGIYTTGNTDVDSRVYISWAEMEKVTGKTLDYAPYIMVRVKDDYSDQAVINQILQYGITTRVRTAADVIAQEQPGVLMGYPAIGSVFFVVSLVIAALVFFIFVRKKTAGDRRQVGIRKALGMDTPVIIHSYGFQAVLLSAAGILLGCVITGLVMVCISFFSLVTSGSSTFFSVTPADLAFNGSILFLVSVLAGYIPAVLVSRENIECTGRMV
ncbi:MAG: ABC transporter permease [Methanoregula sp.]|jgi:putative ABC transport system permease protein